MTRCFVWFRGWFVALRGAGSRVGSCSCGVLRRVRGPAVSRTRPAVDDTSLILYDVTTLYFEAEKEDGLRKVVGYSKERRVDPQILPAVR